MLEGTIDHVGIAVAMLVELEKRGSDYQVKRLYSGEQMQAFAKRKEEYVVSVRVAVAKKSVVSEREQCWEMKVDDRQSLVCEVEAAVRLVCAAHGHRRMVASDQ